MRAVAPQTKFVRAFDVALCGFLDLEPYRAPARTGPLAWSSLDPAAFAPAHAEKRFGDLLLSLEESTGVRR
jgi:hypothetical protein